MKTQFRAGDICQYDDSLFHEPAIIERSFNNQQLAVDQLEASFLRNDPSRRTFDVLQDRFHHFTKLCTSFRRRS